MGNSAVKEHLETAQKTGVFALPHSKLTEFPPKLVELKSVLRTLDLSENRLTVIPDDIKCFVHLKHLRLNRNRLGALPEAVGDLKKLESLYAVDNTLVAVPKSIANLTHLKVVCFCHYFVVLYPGLFFKDDSAKLLNSCLEKKMGKAFTC